MEKFKMKNVIYIFGLLALLLALIGFDIMVQPSNTSIFRLLILLVVISIYGLKSIWQRIGHKF
jgi:uncharacterized membrane protein YhhN